MLQLVNTCKTKLCQNPAHWTPNLIPYLSKIDFDPASFRQRISLTSCRVYRSPQSRTP